VGSKSKRGEPNRMAPIDPVMLGLSQGATFIARSFSGDKEQLVPILKAALAHRGLALVDVVSPCVTFNDHNGSTKSYLYTRKNELRATAADFVPPEKEILVPRSQNGTTTVTMHNGGTVKFTTVPPGYDPTDRRRVSAYLQEHLGTGEIVTGLLYLDESTGDFHDVSQTSETPLSSIPYETLCPGAGALEKLMEDFR
jgi:2-oxoglutarate ferredoxin oxidoreductase subunit beta